MTSLCYKDALTLAVGTASGQILLYDLRSSQPWLVKDHYYGFPIHSIAFQKGEGLVLSADSKILKMWNENDVRSLSLSPGLHLEIGARGQNYCFGNRGGGGGEKKHPQRKAGGGYE